MEYRSLGESGLKVSVVGLGSWLTFGGSVDRELTREVCRTALEEGVNFFDTADVYSGGAGETALAFGLEGVPRKDYVLASKCFFPTGEGPNDRGLSRKHIFESCEASLRRLGTEYLDLYQCHRFDPATPLEETCRAMDDLCRRGWILYWGMSCWSARRIQEAHDLCRARGWVPPISNQPPYNIFERSIEDEVLPACRELGVGQVVFSPLAQGVLTGKYGDGKEIPDRSRAADPERNRFIGRYMSPEHLAAASKIKAFADELGVPPSAFALAWCLREDGVASTIVGATTSGQCRDNCRASDLEIPKDLLRAVDELCVSLPPARS